MKEVSMFSTEFHDQLQIIGSVTVDLVLSVLWGVFSIAQLCYRKKHATFFTQDWKHAPNYVAKCYMEDVDRQVYFEDVKLQMDAKLWGEEYNRHNPPKKVNGTCVSLRDNSRCALWLLKAWVQSLG